MYRYPLAPNPLDPALAALLAGAPSDMPDLRGMGGALPTPLGPDSLGVPMYQPPGGPPVFMPQQQTAPTLAPNPWQDRLDSLGMALAQMPQPDPRSGALAQFVSGLGRGYGQRRLRDIMKRQGIEEGLKARAAETNKQNLMLTQQQMKDASAIAGEGRAFRRDVQKMGLAAMLKPQGGSDEMTTVPNEPAILKATGLKAGAPIRLSSLIQVRNMLKLPGSAGQPGVDDVAESIADAISSGQQPPALTGLYRYAGPVRAALARRGYDLTKAQLDYTATGRWLSSANGPQQLRMRQAAQTAYESLDVVDQLSEQLRGMVPRAQAERFNRATMFLAKNGAFGQDAAMIARQLDAQIADIVSELGNVYMGGNSPTDHSLKLAAQNLSSNWSQSQLKGATDLARNNLRIRINSVGTSGVISPSNAIGATPGTLNIGGRGVPTAQPIPSSRPPLDSFVRP